MKPTRRERKATRAREDNWIRGRCDSRYVRHRENANHDLLAQVRSLRKRGVLERLAFIKPCALEFANGRWMYL